MNITNPEKIKALIETPEFLSIRNSDEFYFQKGQDKLNDWLGREIEENTIRELIDLSKNYQSFRALSKQNHVLSPIVDELISIVAYMDFHALGKHHFNEYVPPRTIAKASVRMNNWIKHLIKLKFCPQQLKEGNTMNAFRYMTSPDSEINILSIEHRRLAQV